MLKGYYSKGGGGRWTPPSLKLKEQLNSELSRNSWKRNRPVLEWLWSQRDQKGVTTMLENDQAARWAETAESPEFLAIKAGLEGLETYRGGLLFPILTRGSSALLGFTFRRAQLCEGEGLGNSQKAEVAWLEMRGYAYNEVDVSDRSTDPTCFNMGGSLTAFVWPKLLHPKYVLHCFAIFPGQRRRVESTDQWRSVYVFCYRSWFQYDSCIVKPKETYRIFWYMVYSSVFCSGWESEVLKQHLVFRRFRRHEQG